MDALVSFKLGRDNTFVFPKSKVVTRLKRSRIYRICAVKDDSIIVETEK